ncbi:nuclear transport factor 2 family protein [Paraburkholderia tropica]|uniref:nuclear transport factor 2 family protein n=1 Tax=Paraburkholderia tropica TaxID=92647 RepID=UPI0022B240B7|nr:nuclear transport factor 2 family protein [Paraburkholderia tropica]
MPAWFAKAVGALQSDDLDGWMSIYAADAVHEFPFAPPGRPSRLEGRDQIAAYMGQLPAAIRFGSLSDVRVRECGDELIVEATGHHRRVSDDSPRDICYVWFIMLRDGLVTRFRDYMNPLQLSGG